MSEYLVIYENAGPNWSAYVPDLPGCITTGDTHEQCRDSIREAIELYIEASNEMGKPVPEPTTLAGFVRVA